MSKAFAVALLAVSILLVCAPASSTSQNKQYHNPILAGFYPDPSICRVGEDYYLVNSSFSYFPGIPIFQSRDLVNWNLIGHVMDRPEQMDLNGLGVSRGIFAPAIRYFRGTFYVTCTLVDRGGNFVVTSKRPQGPWSNPVWLPEIDGIDPSLFFDDDGKAYLVYNSIPPDNKPLYDGHRTIRMREFDAQKLKVSGREWILVNGGVDISKKPVWIEAPHILHVSGCYYLIAAEGGTGENHSEVVFRSETIDGPYVPYDKNPILTQRNLDPHREFPITSTGHADLVQTTAGDWWAVFLGCRPYRSSDAGCYNTGRETFLAPVKWVDGWPAIDPDHQVVQYSYPLPLKPQEPDAGVPHGGNFVIRDEFQAGSLDPHWIFLRTPLEKWWSLSDRKGCLSIRLRPETCAGNRNPSFIARRQQHAVCSASASFDFSPQGENEKAGLAVFQNEKHFYFICKSRVANQSIVQLFKSGAGSDPDAPMELLNAHDLTGSSGSGRILFRIEAHGNTYSFWYGVSPDAWIPLKDSVDAEFLSTKKAGGFVGCVYALYTTSLGQVSRTTSSVEWFEYKGDDEVYR